MGPISSSGNNYSMQLCSSMSSTDTQRTFKEELLADDRAKLHACNAQGLIELFDAIYKARCADYELFAAIEVELLRDGSAKLNECSSKNLTAIKDVYTRQGFGTQALFDAITTAEFSQVDQEIFHRHLFQSEWTKASIMLHGCSTGGPLMQPENSSSLSTSFLSNSNQTESSSSSSTTSSLNGSMASQPLRHGKKRAHDEIADTSSSPSSSSSSSTCSSSYSSSSPSKPAKRPRTE